MISVKDFGTIGNGIVDDRDSIQHALDAGAGGDVFVPSGHYACGQGSGAWCLRVPANTRLIGQSRDTVTISQSAGLLGSVRLLQLDGAGTTVQSLTLDGDKTHQTPDEHRSGIFAMTSDVTVRSVTSQNFSGDGMSFYSGTDRFVVDNCVCYDNGRDGIALIGSSDGGVIKNSQFLRNRAQQFDTEPGSGVVSRLLVSGCTIDATGSTDYAMTIAGGMKSDGTLVFAHDWLVENNVINGGVEVVWARDVEIVNNRGVNPTSKPCVTVYRLCDDVVVSDNRFTSAATCVQGTVCVVGTASGGPSRVVIRRNRLVSAVFGIFAEGASSVEIYDNDVIGPGVASPSGVGVYLRTTMSAHPLTSAVVRRNRIRNFGALGLAAYNVGAAKINILDVTDNVFDDNSAIPTMHAAMYLNDGNNAVVDARIGGNILLGGCVTELASAPPGGVPSSINTLRWS